MDPEALAQALSASRERTRRLADDLAGDLEWGPQLEIVNAPRWELGHVGWFQEYWCLRRDGGDRHSTARKPSRLADADAFYDSSRVPHAARWALPLPDFDATLAYRDGVLASVLDRLRHGSPGEDDRYFAGLALRHEDMHGEAFHYTRQTLGYPPPRIPVPARFPGARVAGDADIPGGRFRLGAEDDGRWVFDNEKWAHPETVTPFRMSRAPVTCAEFRAFVDDGGYRRREWWTDAGWAARQAAGRDAPLYWRPGDLGWERRRFDRWMPLPEDEPMLHVSAHEAEAWCRWAGRRLPTEAEWEFAACVGLDGTRRRYPWGDDDWTPAHARLEADAAAPVDDHPMGDNPWGVRQLIGNAWEWTSSVFLPYPGFERDPYKEYSAPWFGTHRVLRGGAYSTSPRIATATYRNFFRPERADVFAGFRTCAA